jgi:hypothetical protein
MAVLGIAASVVWFTVINSDADLTEAAKCNPPAAPASAAPDQPPTTLGQALARDSLDRTDPAPPAQALVRVVNASTQRGQAGEITEELRQLGFAQVAAPANDPLYGLGELGCRSQIRFGQQGTAAARTLSLLEPCAELIRDDRQDATVDLAIGKKFDDLRPKAEARKVLEQLTEWAAQQPAEQGGLQANTNPGPTLDRDLLAATRQVTC